MERRASVRVRCRLRCQLGLDRGPAAATIVDLSTGGIGLVMDRLLEVGDSVRVKFAPREGKLLEVDTLVWHARRRRNSRFAIGLVISEPNGEYFDAVRALSEGPTGSPEPKTSAARRPPNGAIETSTFSLRARQCGSSRTRTLYIDAQSLAQARSRACKALPADWTLLADDLS